MNNNRKQSTDPLFPTTSSIFNSFSSSLLMPSSSPSLPPTTPQRRRFEVLLTHTTTTQIRTHRLPPYNDIDDAVSSSIHTKTTTHKTKRRRSNQPTSTPTPCTTQRQNTLFTKKPIPLECQMDTATLYDQTHKYVKFLEAQVTVLQSMPLLIPTTTTHRRPRLNNNVDDDHYRTMSGVEELGRLNRQQLLQVLMSSEVAQTVM